MRGESDRFGHSMVPLKSLLKKVETGWSPVCEPKPPGADEWGILKLSAVTSGAFIESEAKRFPDQLTPRPAYEVKSGDILMSRANGVQALVGVTCSVGDVRPKLLLPDLVFRLVPDPGVLEAEFLSIALTSVDARRQIDSVMRGTSGQYKVSQADVRGLEIPDLCLPDQRRIVAAHTAFYQRIAALQESLNKLSIVRRGIIGKAMSGPAVRLGDLLSRKPRNGFSPPEVHEWTGLLTLGLGCLTPQGFIPRQLKRISSTAQAEKFILSDGDLLVSRANTRELVGLAGRFRDVGQPCIYPDLMMRLRPDSDRCLPSYLEIVLGTSAIRKAVQSAARGTSESMVKISSGVVEALRIPLPALRAQEEIVAAVGALDARIAKQSAAVAKLRVIQEGVVEELLGGRRPELAA
ncbi:restriction endonuclease subunit S [Streptomyces sp. CS057]|uniref:restriction endonuclease subunit S n=1 Tax=Streptomyces sp. CS057 TaxID=1982764 RepID=UPI000D1ABD06|nr:restriction endonuclease subunit S [Streptomyces sp. CS057]